MQMSKFCLWHPKWYQIFEFLRLRSTTSIPTQKRWKSSSPGSKLGRKFSSARMKLGKVESVTRQILPKQILPFGTRAKHFVFCKWGLNWLLVFLESVFYFIFFQETLDEFCSLFYKIKKQPKLFKQRMSWRFCDGWERRDRIWMIEFGKGNFGTKV